MALANYLPMVFVFKAGQLLSFKNGVAWNFFLIFNG